MNETSGIYYVMGTLLRLHVRGLADHALLESTKLRMIDTIQDLESRLSLYRDHSELSRINAQAGAQPVSVSADTFQIIQRALDFAALTQGACDPTVNPLLRLWGVYGRDIRTPDGLARDLALERVNYRRVELDPARQRVFLTEKGMGLDLGWIGKGYALDRALSVAQAFPELSEVMMDFGGQLLFWNRHAAPVRHVLVDIPGLAQQDLPHILLNENASVSTTSPSERGRHIFDPRSGLPASSQFSVTVIAPTATEADALSTALFVLGEREGSALLQTRAGTRAVFLSHQPHLSERNA